MVTDTEARVADKIRKAVTFAVSAAGTWLLLRVLFRLSQGEQTLADLELWGFFLIAAVAIFWVRATRRMPRRMATDRDVDGSRTDSGAEASRSSRKDARTP